MDDRKQTFFRNFEDEAVASTVPPGQQQPERGHSCPLQCPNRNQPPKNPQPCFPTNVAVDRNIRAPLLLAIVVFEGGGAKEAALGQADAPFLAVGIIGGFA